VIVPNRLACRPVPLDPTVGVPLVRNGGQVEAQVPVHALVVEFWVSLLKAYRVIPLASTR